MPRIPRGETAGGNMRMQVFDDMEDYEYFLELLEIASKREKVEVHAYCLMPNHFHLLLIPQEPNSLSRLMQWVMTSHVRYYHKKNKTSGHIWQGRYKSFIVEKESYYITLLRYIEANARRAKLVRKAEDLDYGSLMGRVNTIKLRKKPSVGWVFQPTTSIVCLILIDFTSVHGGLENPPYLYKT